MKRDTERRALVAGVGQSDDGEVTWHYDNDIPIKHKWTGCEHITCTCTLAVVDYHRHAGLTSIGQYSHCRQVALSQSMTTTTRHSDILYDKPPIYAVLQEYHPFYFINNSVRRQVILTKLGRQHLRKHATNSYDFVHHALQLTPLPCVIRKLTFHAHNGARKWHAYWLQPTTDQEEEEEFIYQRSEKVIHALSTCSTVADLHWLS